MKNLALILVFSFISSIGISQNNPLSIFNNLMGKTWKAEGNWENGTAFKQEKTFKYSLDSTLVIVNTIGFIDKKQLKLGNRNLGIRQYDKKSDSIKFWEYDVFGGLTTGNVFAKDKNLVHQYEYFGSEITDMWEYIDDSTYHFKVGIWKNNTWEKLFLNTQFTVVE